MKKYNMKSKLSLEAFVFKTITKDGYSVIVGGICPEGMKEEAVIAYQSIRNMEIDNSRDEFLIDYILADVITKLSPNWILLAGASICIDGVNNNTGGIIGNPFNEHESSREDIEEIKEGLYLISFSGGPGVAYAGTYSDGVLIRNIIVDYKITQSRNYDNIINKLDEITSLYILVFDGCGSLSCGGIYISDCYGKEYGIF